MAFLYDHGYDDLRVSETPAGYAATLPCMGISGASSALRSCLRRAALFLVCGEPAQFTDWHVDYSGWHSVICNDSQTVSAYLEICRETAFERRKSAFLDSIEEPGLIPPRGNLFIHLDVFFAWLGPGIVLRHTVTH